MLYSSLFLFLWNSIITLHALCLQIWRYKVFTTYVHFTHISIKHYITLKQQSSYIMFQLILVNKNNNVENWKIEILTCIIYVCFINYMFLMTYSLSRLNSWYADKTTCHFVDCEKKEKVNSIFLGFWLDYNFMLH